MTGIKRPSSSDSSYSTKGCTIHSSDAGGRRESPEQPDIEGEEEKEEERISRGQEESQQQTERLGSDKSPAVDKDPGPSPPPPLPNEVPPDQVDDGWEPVWDSCTGAYYFYNRFTSISQWENPRVADTESVEAGKLKSAARVAGGYNPAVHGDYDPTAPYAQNNEQSREGPTLPVGAPGTTESAETGYLAAGSFNRFTGKWQALSLTPENFNDESKARRQMSAFFDVDAAANSHDGRSLRAERSAKKLSRKELKMFKEKRREKKEEKRRAWLRD